MITVYLTYLWKFFTVVVINCLNPANMVQCLAIGDWVPPAINDLKEFKANPPYSKEKDFLKTVPSAAAPLNFPQ